MYLRKLKKLRSFNVDGNPCLEKEGYFDYLYAFVPQLIYCRYKMITNKERQLALEQHHRTISNLEENEAKEKEEEDARRAFEKHIDLLSKSYVEYLDGNYLFEQMFKHDGEGRNLITLTEDTQVAYEEYKKTFSAICQELYELGLKEEARRRNEIRQFEDIVNGGKQKVQEDARKTMDEVMKRKSEIFLDVKTLIESMTGELETDVLEEKVEQAQRLSEDFNDFISRIWTKLIYKEVVLHEQVDDINEVFKINMTDMVESFLEAAQSYFAQLRNADAEYNDNINTIATIYINSFGTNDENKIPPHVLEICGDKDLLTNNLAASRDVHLQIIDGREDRMVGRLKNWLEKHVEKLIEEESERHRSGVLEISHFLEFQREEFDALQLQRHLSIGSGDPDVIAALEG
ncbi:dynein regulatory complex subunit 3-like isoform X2 [Cephus cinctus]|nr:dynein regulatory complex subunit 3-like isoform X2 [Cephus cinctus]